MKLELVQAIPFLKQCVPFKHLPENKLQTIVEHTEPINLKKGQLLYKKGEEIQNFIFIVYEGAIKLTKNIDDITSLVDLFEEGDILGLHPLFKKEIYSLNAIVHEDATLYKIPVEIIEQFILEDKTFEKNLTSLFSEKSPDYPLKSKEQIQNDLKEEQKDKALVTNDFTSIKPITPVHTIDKNSSVYEAALLMAEKRIGALLISNDKGHPVGIVTDADLNRKVVAADILPSSIKIGQIMSSPVITVSDSPKVSNLLILAAQKKIRHFCVTKDGTDQSEIIGIISERDILAKQGNNPSVLIKKIQHSNSVATLKIIRDTTDILLQTYLEQEVALHFVLDIITHINDAIIEKCIELALSSLKKEGYGEPPVDFCWLSLGSEGRKEQLLRTDQDNAIIYADSETDETTNSKYFIRLGEEVTEMLYEIGFEKCPFEIMANNKNYCRPLESWKRLFEKWIFTSDPNAILNTHIFFDLRPVFGNESLAKSLQQYIFNLIEQEKRFISFLAHNATLNPVPLSFFRKFMVEKKGEFSNLFDIKARALMPISDAARVMAYQAKIPVFGSTIERFKSLADQDLNNKDLIDEIIMAFEILLRIRAKNGLKHKDDGRFVEIDTLNKLQRQSLKQIFALTEKLQQIVKVRFQTDYIR